MADAFWADVSYYQNPVDDSYPHRVFCCRANDGTFRDPNFAQNLAWAKAAADSGRLDCFIVYTVFRENWEQTVATLQNMVGVPHSKMAVMTDVETWGGEITGDHSGQINAMIGSIAAWLGDSRRSIGYGNRGDLSSLWPGKPDYTSVVVASYGSQQPSYPGMIGWQHTDAGPCDPFGTCDMNRSPGMDSAGIAAALGIGAPPQGGFLVALTDQQQSEVYGWLSMLFNDDHDYRLYQDATTGEIVLAAPGQWLHVPNPDYVILYRARGLVRDEVPKVLATNEFQHWRSIYLAVGVVDVGALAKEIAAVLPAPQVSPATAGSVDTVSLVKAVNDDADRRARDRLSITTSGASA